MFLFVFLLVCVCVCVYVSAFVCVYASVTVSSYLCICLYLGVLTCECANTYVHPSINMGTVTYSKTLSHVGVDKQARIMKNNRREGRVHSLSTPQTVQILSRGKYTVATSQT